MPLLVIRIPSKEGGLPNHFQASYPAVHAQFIYFVAICYYFAESGCPANATVSEKGLGAWVNMKRLGYSSLETPYKLHPAI